MRYLCDQVKRAANLKKHEYDLDDAPVVIDSAAAITFEDKRFDYGEQRFIAFGMLHDVAAVIVTAETAKKSA